MVSFNESWPIISHRRWKEFMLAAWAVHGSNLWVLQHPVSKKITVICSSLRKDLSLLLRTFLVTEAEYSFVVYLCGSACEASTSIQATEIIYPLLSFRSFRLQCSREKIFKCVSVSSLLITGGSCTITKYAGLVLRVSTHSQRRAFWPHLMTDWLEKMEQVLKRWMSKQWY